MQRWLTVILLLSAVVSLQVVAQTAGQVSSAAQDELRLVGLAMHAETGRNIYIGGIFIDALSARSDDLAVAPGPKKMRFRIVARRTSVRRLLGNIMLQSELATGRAPGEAALSLADTVLATIDGSLYAGDALDIVLDRMGHTVVQLNGHQLATAATDTIANYFMRGWVDPQGSSTAFRQSITALNIDSSLRTQFEDTIYTAAREEQVLAWLSDDITATDGRPTTKTPEATAGIEAEPTPHSEATPATALADDIFAPKADLLALLPKSRDTSTRSDDVAPVSNSALPIHAAGSAEPLLKTPAPHEESPVVPRPAAAAIKKMPIQANTVEVAALTQVPASPQDSLPDDISGLSIIDYSQRLAQFNTDIVRRVYSQIKYPGSAVRRNLQGRLELDINVDADGKLVDVIVGTSSGYRILDKAAVKAAKGALTPDGLTEIDPVARAEYHSERGLTIPVPVTFILTP